MIIKENLLYSFIFIFGYGVFAGGLPIDTNLKIFHLISPLIFFSLVFLFNKNDEILIEFKRKNFLTLNISHYVYFFLIFIILLFLAKERIFLSVADDEYAYANLGLIHSNFLISKISELQFIGDLKIKYIFQLFSFLLLTSVLIYLYLLNKIFKDKLLIKFFIIIFTVFVLRLVIIIFGGNAFPHPPILGLFSLISTSFLSLSDLSLKVLPFTFYCFFSFYYFFKLEKILGNFLSFIVVISLFSIPGVLYLSSLLEQSLFSMLCFSIISVELCLNKNPNYKKLIIIILIFSFLRILSILALVLIGFHILLNSKSVKDLYEKCLQTIKNSYPLLLLIPFIFFSFTNNSNLNVDRIGLDFFNFYFFSKILPHTIVNNFTFVASFLVFISLIVLVIFPKKNLFLIFFIIISIIIYGNELSRDNKYAYEIFFPIILSSLVINLNLIKNLFIKFFLIISISACLISNIFILKTFSSNCLLNKKPFQENHNYETKFGCKIIYAHPFNLNDSFKFLKDQDNFSFVNLYVPGVYYGILPSIINGMKVSEYRKHKEINTNQNSLNVEFGVSWMSANANNINNDEEIKFVLLADLKNPEKLSNELINLGWVKIYENNNQNFMTKSKILSKK